MLLIGFNFVRILISVVPSRPVRDFFCFDDPPGPHDSLEESRVRRDRHILIYKISVTFLQGCHFVCIRAKPVIFSNFFYLVLKSEYL